MSSTATKTANCGRIGAHVSVAGGVSRAFERARGLGCEAMQIFVKNASQWRGKPLADEEVMRFVALRREAGAPPIVAHGSYLINLASNDCATRERSKGALLDELRRCHRLEVDGLVLHPGAHLGAGEEIGLRRFVAALDQTLSRHSHPGPRVLIENTAGQGSLLGHRLEHLATILERSALPARLGLCIDTCHAFAAGYAIHREEGWEDLVRRLDALCGWESVRCMHLNDSVCELGSRRDRHANLGRGRIGSRLFSRLAADPRLGGLPLIVETPSPDGKGHARDLGLLRRARRRPRRR
jgi:deoxyribonuclease-4